MTDKKQDLIDRYIREEMNDEERASFEQDLTTDEELSEMYKYTLKVRDAIKSRNEKLEKINQWNTDDEERTPHIIVVRRIVYTIVSVAAVVVIFFMLNHKPSMPELDINRYECYRGANNTIQAAQLIKNKQYDDALKIINRIECKTLSAIDSVKRVIPTVTSDELPRIDYEISALNIDYNEIRWLKVYAFVGLELYKEAYDLLTEIRDEKTMYSAKADSLLKEF